jgi:uncharacterized RDD family membrane protein YckC
MTDYINEPVKAKNDEFDYQVLENPRGKPKDEAVYELADIGQRFLALIIDGIILGIITGILFGAAREPGFGASFIVGVVYQWYFLTRQNGQAPGKMVMKIRVIKTTGEPMTDSDPIIRYVGTYINSIVFGLGWFWALWDENRQGWHDKMANTYVVKADV